jgi:hypothetical protein
MAVEEGPQEMDGGRWVRIIKHLDPSVRPPAANGNDRVELEIHGTDAMTRVPEVEREFALLVEQLPSIAADAQGRLTRPAREAIGDTQLWLDAVEFHDVGTTILSFDVGLDYMFLNVTVVGGAVVASALKE